MPVPLKQQKKGSDGIDQLKEGTDVSNGAWTDLIILER